MFKRTFSLTVAKTFGLLQGRGGIGPGVIAMMKVSQKHLACGRGGGIGPGVIAMMKVS